MSACLLLFLTPPTHAANVERVLAEGTPNVAAVAAGDLDGDGDNDVVSVSETDDRVVLVENLGAGFAPDVTLTAATPFPTDVAIADLDGDGLPDLVVSSASDDDVYWLQNLGGLLFAAPAGLITGGGANFPERLAVVDLDGDGDLDLLVGELHDDEISWFPNLGAASFGPGVPIDGGLYAIAAVEAADLDGDGAPDAIIAGSGLIWYPNGGATFSVREAVDTTGDYSDVVPADLDGDGDVDLLAVTSNNGPGDGTTGWFANLGGGVFGPIQALAPSGYQDSVLPIDLDKDGDLDVIATRQDDGLLLSVENLGGGTFAGPVGYADTSGWGSLVAADLDEDGDDDVLFGDWVESEVSWFDPDSDTDGLGDAEERFDTHTDPLIADTDGGGVLDGAEADAGTDPRDGTDDDGDRDGLGNAAEAVAGTDPSDPDTDGDGLFDGAEILASSDPLDPDTDGAGVEDGPEVAQGTDPTDPLDDDRDTDGLSDLDEAVFGTDVDDPDTDGDGLLDGQEVNHATDPLLADSDGGGADDGVEAAAGTDPLDPLDDDGDGDGLTDPTEAVLGTDPDLADTDADGLDDAAELALLTDPLDPDTDHGGTVDGVEVDNGRNPRDPQDDWRETAVGTDLLGVLSATPADLDGDGDLDVLASASDVPAVVWWENLGFGTFGPSLPVSGREALQAVAADLDGDGDLDVVLPDADGNEVLWVENTGGAFGPESVVRTGPRSASSIATADLDGDGDTDVFSGTSGEDGRLFRSVNDGSGGFGPSLVLPLPGGSAQQLAVLDVDQDGLADVARAGNYSSCGLLSCNHPSQVGWNASGAGFASTVIPALAEGMVDLAAVDVDADGWTDLVGVASTDGAVVFWPNVGGGFGAMQVLWDGCPSCRAVAAGDLDGDGDVDLVYASTYSTGWLENAAGWVPHPIAGTGGFDVALADLDGDGPLDVLVADQVGDRVIWYRNALSPDTDGDGLSDSAETEVIGTDPTLADTDGGGVDDGAEIDLGTDPLDRDDDDRDADGLSDLDEGLLGTDPSNEDSDFDGLTDGEEVLVTHTDPLLADTDGSGTPDGQEVADGRDPLDPTDDDWPIHWLDASIALNVVPFDLDGDGDLDLASATYAGVQVLVGRGGAQFDPPVRLETEDRIVQSILAIDLGGDGRPDLVTGELFPERLTLYRNLSGPDYPFFEQGFLPELPLPTDLAAADLDADGDLDLVVGARPEALSWFENDGGDLVGPNVVTVSNEGLSAVLALDVDGDGDMDVAAADDELNAVSWFPNQGQGVFDAGWAVQGYLGSPIERVQDLAAGDLDGDGDPDFVAVSEGDQSVVWWPNVGAGVFGEAQVLTTEVLDPRAVAVFDLDGDGDQDIVVGQRHDPWGNTGTSPDDDRVGWFEGRGGGVFAAFRPLCTELAVNELDARDVDGDGDLDLIVATDAGLVWLEQPEPPETPTTPPGETGDTGTQDPDVPVAEDPAAPGPKGEEGGCGCGTAGGSPTGWVIALVALRRSRRHGAPDRG